MPTSPEPQDPRLVAGFDSNANDPMSWVMTGGQLVAASEVLRCNFDSDWQKLVQEGRYRDIHRGFLLQGPMLMLRACAVECYLKAIFVDAGGTFAKNGHYRGPTRRAHDFVALANAARWPLSDGETLPLQRLQPWITRGRYPIQTDWEKHYLVHSDAQTQGVSWGDVDEARYAHFAERLKAEASRIDARAKRIP